MGGGGRQKILCFLYSLSLTFPVVSEDFDDPSDTLKTQQKNVDVHPKTVYYKHQPSQPFHIIYPSSFS